jgi:lysophospholipase L1-like esterase
MKKILVLLLIVKSALTFSQQLIIEEPLRYLALGDSYTIGQSVAIEDRFPVQLLDLLKSKYNLDDAEVDIIARTGWTTENLKAGIEIFFNDSVEYNLVSLLIGVNNQYQKKDIDDYRPAFTELLERSIQIAGNDRNRVFVVSIPDYSYTPSHAAIAGISEEIDAYNRINKEVSFTMGVRYVDITSISRRGLKQPELVASDGLHPSGVQYSEWVQLISEALNKPLHDLAPAAEDTTLKVRVDDEQLYIDLPNPGGNLSIFDIKGRLVKEEILLSEKISISIQDLTSGYYIVNYTLEDQKFSGKVFVN